MRKYETVLVINPDLSEAALKEELKKIEGQLQTNGAQNIRVDRWGKRELGYEMRKHRTGFYVVINFETDNSDLNDVMTGLLRINDNVLKFQSHRINEKTRAVKNARRAPKTVSDDLGLDTDYATA